MPELKTAMMIVEVIIAVIVAMALGEYLGHKFGVLRVAAYLGVIALVVIVAFAVYAAIVLS